MGNIQYLAGIIDGEGCIFVKRSTYRMRSEKYGDCKNPEFHPLIQVKMTNEEVLRLLAKEFGGSIYQEKRLHPSRSGFAPRKLLWVWHTSDRKAAQAFEQLIPFLIVKKKNAENAFALYKFKKSIHREKHRAFSTGEVARLEEYYQMSKRLNK